MRCLNMDLKGAPFFKGHWGLDSSMEFGCSHPVSSVFSHQARRLNGEFSKFPIALHFILQALPKIPHPW